MSIESSQSYENLGDTKKWELSILFHQTDSDFVRYSINALSLVFIEAIPIFILALDRYVYS